MLLPQPRNLLRRTSGLSTICWVLLLHLRSIIILTILLTAISAVLQQQHRDRRIKVNHLPTTLHLMAIHRSNHLMRDMGLHTVLLSTILLNMDIRTLLIRHSILQQDIRQVLIQASQALLQTLTTASLHSQHQHNLSSLLHLLQPLLWLMIPSLP